MNPKLKCQLGLDRPKRTAAIIAVLALLHFCFPRYVVATGSMEPTIPVGSYVVTSRLAFLFGPPKAGDIVVFDPVAGISTRPWVHRIQAVSGDRFVPPERAGRKDTDSDAHHVGGERVPTGYVYQSGDSAKSYHGLAAQKLITGKVFWHFRLPWKS